MPKYRVTVGRDRSEYAEIELEADNEFIAKERARLTAEHNGSLLTWTLDQEAIIGSPYVACLPELVPEDDDAG